MISQANRGMALEQLVEYANNQYSVRGWALIQKISTPWKVIRRGKQIVSAFPEKKSTVDFIGIAQGKSIAFDAKGTSETTRFPLSNIEQHQMDFLESFQDQGGVAFFLIEFTKRKEHYIIPYKDMGRYWNHAEIGGRKSIPYEDMINYPMIKQGRGIVLDYLGEVIKL